MATSNGGNLSTFSSTKQCPIHFGPLKDARSLPCGHTFCLECMKPYSSTNRVVCPLCNATHKTDIYLLPPIQSPGALARSLIDALPPSADEFLSKSKAMATENALKNVESACDMVVELLESMKNDFKDMKSSFQQKRQSLADELKQMEQNAKCENTPEDEKSAESKNLATICDMFQRVCALAQDRALQKMLHVSKDVEDVCRQVKSIGLCRYYVDSEFELDETREKEIMDCLAQLVQRHAYADDFKALCENMITSFPRKMSEYKGIWTAVVGEKNLTWNVPSSILVQGQTSSLKMLVYCSPEVSSKDATHKLGMKISQTRFKNMLDRERNEPKSNDQDMIGRIWKKVNEEFGGKWHCIVGNEQKLVIKSNGDRKFVLREEFDGREFVCWKY